MKKEILKLLRQIFAKQKKEIPLGVEAAGLDMQAEKIARELSDIGYRGPVNLDLIKRIQQALKPTYTKVWPKSKTSGDVLDMTGKKIHPGETIVGGKGHIVEMSADDYKELKKEWFGRIIANQDDAINTWLKQGINQTDERFINLSKTQRKDFLDMVEYRLKHGNVKFMEDSQKFFKKQNGTDIDNFAYGGIAGMLGEPEYMDDTLRVPYDNGKLVEGEVYIPPKNYYSIGIGPVLNEFMSEGVPRDEEGFHTTLNKKDLKYLWEVLQGKHPIEDIEDQLMFRFSRMNPEEQYKFHFGIGKDKKEIGFKKKIDFNKWLMGKAGGGIAGMLGEPTYADGGRTGFKLGGIDKARRAFLKWLGVGAATAGVAKSGLLSILKGGKPVVETLTQVPIKNIKGMPEWYPALVNQIIKKGKQVESGAERVIVHKSKLPGSKTDLYLTQELDTGHVAVDIGSGKHGFADGHLGQPVRLEYRASEVIEPVINTKTKKVIHKRQKTKPEFNVEEAEFTGGHPENVKFEESTLEKFGEHGSNFDEVEKFATGKVKKVKSTKKKLQTEYESGKAEADAERWTEEGQPQGWTDKITDVDDFASGGRVPLAGGSWPGMEKHYKEDVAPDLDLKIKKVIENFKKYREYGGKKDLRDYMDSYGIGGALKEGGRVPLAGGLAHMLGE